MSELFDKSIRTLELPRVLQLLSDQAVSAEAKARALRVRPETEPEEVLRLLDQTDAARAMIGLHGAPSFSGVKPVAEALDRADRGGSLNTRELLTIAGLLTAARRAKEYFNDEAVEKTAIDHLFLSLHGNRFLEEKIKRCIVDEDTIADAASTELADIRRHMRAAQAKSRQILQKIISSPSYGKILQETIITQRDGRFVVPVKAEHKGDLPGLVHDISSSGATLFVEPMGVVQANNELIELEAKEQKEIERILAELSADSAAHREDIQWDYDTLVHLDLIFARGQLSYKMDGIRPEVRRDGAIHLRRARHPLLDAKKAVPIDIELGDTFDTLVITGPNTGGKTVSLKTLGLLTLMTQCGLHIPVGDRSAISVYERVLADIGDEQSIEQSLSTFSSHMTTIVEILSHADEDSLCLFDELGAGTDPTEGAALAIAILNHLHDRGIRTMATTHYSELKLYALSTPFVENACCEFDVESLRPTYRLLIGIPGKSNAFAISSKLGLPDDIIEAAKEQLSKEDESFEDVIAGLENSRKNMEKEKEEIAAYKERIKTLEQQLKAKNEKIDQAKDRILREANEKARAILQEAKDVADEAISDFNKVSAGTDIKQLENKRQNLRKKIDEKNERLSLKTPPKQSAPRLDPKKLKKGDSVKILSLGLKGTVSTLPDAKGNLFIQCGIMRSQANVNDLMLLADEDTASRSVKGFSSPGDSVKGSGRSSLSKSMTISPEINLLGMTCDEAIAALDKYLDDAYLSHLSSVRVVHGKGTGALRSAVQNHLKRLKYVKEYRLGEYGEGDAGVTIVTFK